MKKLEKLIKEKKALENYLKHTQNISELIFPYAGSISNTIEAKIDGYNDAIANATRNLAEEELNELMPMIKERILKIYETMKIGDVETIDLTITKKH